MTTPTVWPDVWFHGSECVFERFDPRRIGGATGVKSPGFWCSSDAHAAGYFGPCLATCALGLEPEAVLVVTEEDRKERGRQSPSYWAREARETGYHAVVLTDVCDGDSFSAFVVCVFDPSHVTIRSWANVELAYPATPLSSPGASSRSPKP